MATSRNMLRWISVFPAGIIGAFIIALPVHWLVMINLGGWGMDPIIVIEDVDTIRKIERILQAVFGPLAFVYFAARVTPSHRLITSALLAGIVVFGLPILVYWSNLGVVSDGNGIFIDHGIAKVVANVLGVSGGMYLIRSREKKNSD